MAGRNDDVSVAAARRLRREKARIGASLLDVRRVCRFLSEI
jgi:hypothetical protein